MAFFQRMEHAACELYTQIFNDFYIVQRSNLRSNMGDDTQVFY